MRQTWRWFGPVDRVSIDDILQAGAEGIVTALHHIPAGEVWSRSEIGKRKAEISRMHDGSPSGLNWEVAESLPVSEDIKKQTGDWQRHTENYNQSLRNLADEGVRVICYNFMPVLDWTRTDLSWRLSHGGTTMRFDLTEFAAFDIHILQRPGAQSDYPEQIQKAAAILFADLSEAAQQRLTTNIACGLPGAADTLSLNEVKQQLEQYASIDSERLRQHFTAFLEQVVPVAENVGVRLCCHPDDPPFPLLGLPRIMSTEADYTQMLDAIDSPANGMALCAGSLAARPDNDIPGMIERLGDRLHFLHMRNVKRETAGVPASFHESEHLNGDTDMVALISALLSEEARRKAQGRADWNIPIRPDHGLDILDDLNRKAQPGYPSIGRLKGLAELRGIMLALSHPKHGQGDD